MANNINKLLAQNQPNSQQITPQPINTNPVPVNPIDKLLEQNKPTEANDRDYLDRAGQAAPIELDSKYDIGIGASHTAEDIQENRAISQDWADKWANGLVKAVGVAGTSALESTAGLVYGLGAAIGQGKLSKIYDNDFSRTLDEFNNTLAEQLPNYYSKAAKEYGLGRELLTANFWADKFLNGAGYAAGALVTGYGLSKFAALSKLAGAGKLVGVSEEAIAASQELTDLAKRIKFLNNADYLKNSVLMSTGESAAEARQAKDATKDRLLKDLMLQHQDIPNYKPTEEELKTVEDLSDSAGNLAYGLNLVITGTSNALQFKKMLGPGYNANKLELNDITKKAIQNGEIAIGADGLPILQGEIKTVGRERIKKVGEGIIEEGGQEGLQSTTQTAVGDYYGRRFDKNNPNHNFLESTIEGLKNTLGTKEGWESILLGALLGGPMGAKGVAKDVAQSNENTAKVVDLINNSQLLGGLKNTVENATQVASYQAAKDAALKKGDIFEYKNLEFQERKSYIKQVIESGGTDLLLDKLESTKGMSPQEFKKTFGYSETFRLNPEQAEDTQSDVIKHIEESKKQILGLQDAYTKIQTAFPVPNTTDPTKQIVNKALKEELWDAATNIDNIDKREKELSAKISRLTHGLLNVNSTMQTALREEFGDDYQKEFDRRINKDLANITNPLVRSEVMDAKKDIDKLAKRREAYINAYNNLVDPAKRGEFEKEIKKIQEKAEKEVKAKKEEESKRAKENQTPEQKAKEKETFKEQSPAPPETPPGPPTPPAPKPPVFGAAATENEDINQIDYFEEIRNGNLSVEEAMQKLKDAKQEDSDVYKQLEEIVKKQKTKTHIENKSTEDHTDGAPVDLTYKERKDLENSIKESLTLVTEAGSEIDPEGHVITLGDLIVPAANAFAYSSRNYNQTITQNGKILYRVLNNVDNELNQNLQEPLLLSSTSYLPGEEITLELDKSFNQVFTSEDGTTKQVITYDSFNNDINRVPIKIVNKEGKTIAYLHDLNWVNETNVSNKNGNVDFQKDLLRQIRQEVFNNISVTTRILGKSNGKLAENVNGNQKTSEVFQDPNLQLVVGKKNNFYLDTDTPLTGNGPLNKQVTNGVTYALVSLPSGKKIALPLQQTLVSDEIAESLAEVTEAYLTKNVEVANKIEAFTGLNILTKDGLRRYFNLFIYTNDFTQDTLDALVGREDRVLIDIAGAGIKYGSGGNTMTDVSNINYWDKLDFIDHMKKVPVAIFLSKLNNKEYRTTLINANGEVKNQIQTYTDFVKENTTTNLISYKLPNGEYVYADQPVITFSTDFALPKPGGVDLNVIYPVSDRKAKKTDIERRIIDLQKRLDENKYEKEKEDILNSLTKGFLPTGFRFGSSIGIIEKYISEEDRWISVGDSIMALDKNAVKAIDKYFNQEGLGQKILNANNEYKKQIKPFEEREEQEDKNITDEQTKLLSTKEGILIRKDWSLGKGLGYSGKGTDGITEFDPDEDDNKFEAEYYLTGENDEWIELSYFLGKTKQEVIDKINAKYDAELAALEGGKQATPNVVTVYHHTSVSPQNFNFGNFQRGKDQVSQFGDGLNASTTTNEFFVKRYGNPIQGEVNDSDFVVIDANKSEKELYEELVAKGYKFNNPATGSYIGNKASKEYDSNDKANVSPAVISLFNDFQKSNPQVKGVKVINHIIGNQKVDPFYVIYDSKSFYGPGSLSKLALEGIPTKIAPITPPDVFGIPWDPSQLELEEDELPSTLTQEEVDAIIKDSLLIPGFSATRQAQIVEMINSIVLKSLKESSKQGSILYNEIKSKFEELLLYSQQINNKGLVNEFTKILNNFDSLVSLSKQNLTLFNIKETLVSGELGLEDLESSNEKTNFNDEASYSIDYKDSMSGRLKQFFSFVPDVKKNYLGFPSYISFDTVTNYVQSQLANLTPDFAVMRATLEESAKSKPWVTNLLQALDATTEQNKNEFVQWASKYKDNQKTFLWVTGPKTKGSKELNYSLRVIDTNQNSITNVIKEQWLENLKDSPLVKESTTIPGELVINKVRAAELLTALNVIDKTNINDVQGWLSNLGIEVSIETLQELEEKGKSKYGISIEKHFTDSNGIFKPIIDKLKGNEKETEDTENPLALNNPLVDNSGIDKLAAIEAKYTTSHYSNSHKDGEGNTVFAYTAYKYLLKQFNRLKFNQNNIVDNMKKISFQSTSKWLEELANPNSYFTQVFNISRVDTLRKQKSARKGTKLAKMSPREHEISKISAFQNQNNGRKTGDIFNRVSHFFFPTMSDKAQMMMVTTVNHNTEVTINADKSITLKAPTINALVDVIEGEYRRIRTYQESGIKTNIDGYNPEMFYFFKELNNAPQLWEDGRLKAFNDDQRNFIKEFLQDRVNVFTQQKLQEWENLGLFKEGNLSFMDKSYISKFIDERLVDKNDVNRAILAATDMVVNYMITNANIFQTIIGDPALFYKKNIDETWINIGKRLAAEIAPGLDLADSENNKYTQVFLKDQVNVSKYIDKIEETIGKEKASNYRLIESTDAQEYTTLTEHLYVLEKSGKIDDTTLANIRNSIKNNKKLNAEQLDIILQPVKPVYVESIIDSEGNVIRKIYIKSSSFPLIPQLTKGLEIDKLRVAMEAQNIDRAAYKTATKVGGPKQFAEIWDENNNIKSDLNFLKNHTLVLPRTGFRIQQEVPYDAEKEEINRGTQETKLLWANILNIEGIRSLHADYVNTYNELFKLSQKELFDNILEKTEKPKKIPTKNLVVSKIIRNFAAYQPQLEQIGINTLEDLNNLTPDDLASLIEKICK